MSDVQLADNQAKWGASGAVCLSEDGDGGGGSREGGERWEGSGSEVVEREGEKVRVSLNTQKPSL